MSSSDCLRSVAVQAIVDELNKHIISQMDAKKAVAVALRNRWRRRQLTPALQQEVYTMNILLIGPTGSGARLESFPA